VDGNEGPLAAGSFVHRARDQLLANAAFTGDDDRYCRCRHLGQGAKLPLQRRHQCDKPWGSAKLARVHVGRLVADAAGVGAKQEKRMAELDQSAVREWYAIDLRAIDHSSVGGATVFQEPKPAAPHESRVYRRDAVVRNAQAQLAQWAFLRSNRIGRATAAD